MNLRFVVRTGLVLAAFGIVWGQEPADPPSRVARLNYVNGQVSFRPDSVEQWTAATLNYPLTTGDHLWADQGGYAEMHIGSTAVRLSGQTAFAILNLNDRAAQVSVSQGALNVRVRRLDAEEAFEVDTPNGAVSLLRPGEYRIDVYPDQNSTAVLVRGGEAEVTAGGQAFPVHARQIGRFTGTDQISSEVVAAPGPDEWDRWCIARDQHEDRAMQASMQYVPREMIGAEDLSGYGVWRNDPRYGAVWMPIGMAGGWAPYRNGHWAYVRPWGWTWIDDAPWGFAPFHYGRWAYMDGGWGWVPGTMVARPVYAPALVAFVGGHGFSAAISIGGGGMAAWIPLGPREVYRPAYHVSETYVRNVNITHVTNVTNITNVTNVNNVTYVNRTYVTAVPQNVFTGARPVSAAAVHVPPAAMSHVEHVDVGAVNPGQASLVGRAMQPGMHAGAPPNAAVTRPVFVKNTPPVTSHTIVPVRSSGVASTGNTTSPGFNAAQGVNGRAVVNNPSFNRPGLNNNPTGTTGNPHVINDRPVVNNPGGSTGPANPTQVINNRPVGNNTPLTYKPMNTNTGSSGTSTHTINNGNSGHNSAEFNRGSGNKQNTNTATEVKSQNTTSTGKHVEKNDAKNTNKEHTNR